LLAPVSIDAPAGPDLSYAEVAVLERLATPGRGPAGEPVEPDWARVIALATELMGRTRDLRVAIRLTHAALVLHGLPGLRDGLQLTAALLETCWQDLHPRPEPDDATSAQERLNLLAHLSPDPDQSHPAPEAEAFRQALRHHATPGSPRASRDVDPRSEAVDGALEALDRVGRTFARWTGATPRFLSLRRTLERMGRSLRPEQQPPDAPSTSRDDDAGECAGDTGSASSLSAPRCVPALATRDDAVRVLGQVAHFVRASQPSSPAPLFIERAAHLLQMDFADIVRTLLPAARPQVELLAGISLEAPSSISTAADRR
jgi:type VI secretion system protein ImpA